MLVNILQFGATTNFNNNMKKWTELLVGDPIYILEYYKNNITNFTETKCEGFDNMGYAIAIGYYVERLANDKDFEGTGLRFPLHKTEFDNSKTEYNNKYFFCDIDAVIDEMNEYEKDLNDLKYKFNKLYDTIIDVKNK